MDDQQEQRLAQNEALFREVNEAIERGNWPGDEYRQSAFRCECAREDCAQLVQMTPDEYERVRTNGRRFILLPGHEQPAVETVIKRLPGYVVVEKRGPAGAEAEASDPRS